MKPYPPRNSGWYIDGVQVPRPIVALDIDGTLGDYYGQFLAFAADWLGKPVPLTYDGSVPMHRWIGVSKERYRKIKLAYRQGGIKRSMPVYDGARELTVAVRKRGADIWICTTRPYLHLNTIEPDTLHWLKRNGIQYDNVLFGENKYRDLRRMAMPMTRVVMVLDDLPEMVQQASECGLPAILRGNTHNSTYRWSPCVASLVEAQALALTLLDKWEGQYR